jgi:uncharacterized repeat protein (TIGR01451 family)
VVLTDLLPPTVTFVRASDPCTLTGNTLTCNLGQIPASTTRTVTITVTPNVAGIITNSATAQGSGQNFAQNTATTLVVAPTLATLVVTKDAPATAVVGQPFVYVIRVRNLGPDAAMNVVLTDLLPPFVTLPDPGSGTQVGDQVTFDLGTIPAGEDRLVLLLATATVAEAARNIASAQGTNTNVAQAVTTTQVLLPTTLILTKTDNPDPAFVGGTLTYTLSVFNAGDSPAENVVLTDDLPDSVLFLSSNVPCSLANLGVLICNLGTIPAHNVTTVTIQVRPLQAGTLTNDAAAQGTNTNLATDTETTQVIEAADLAVTKTANPRAQVGQGLTYTVTVTNNGPSTATGVVLVDELPASVRFITATPSQGSCDIAGFRLTCLLGTLAPGETATVTILVVPTRPGFLTNTARVFSDVLDPNPADNTASLTTAVFQCRTGFPC